jgi:hypothetical protein
MTWPWLHKKKWCEVWEPNRAVFWFKPFVPDSPSVEAKWGSMCVCCYLLHADKCGLVYTHDKENKQEEQSRPPLPKCPIQSCYHVKCFLGVGLVWVKRKICYTKITNTITHTPKYTLWTKWFEPLILIGWQPWYIRLYTRHDKTFILTALITLVTSL